MSVGIMRNFVIFETQCVEICGTVGEKSRCILKGYHAIVNKVFYLFLFGRVLVNLSLSLSLCSLLENHLSHSSVFNCC